MTLTTNHSDLLACNNLMLFIDAALLQELGSPSSRADLARGLPTGDEKSVSGLAYSAQRSMPKACTRIFYLSSKSSSIPEYVLFGRLACRWRLMSLADAYYFWQC